MRIVLVNWAKIWDGASHGGGANGYCQSLALALRNRGHEVVSLVSGTTYLEAPQACLVRRHEDWLGIKVFEVVNSPVLAPSLMQFRAPLAEIRSPELERVVGELFEALSPDVVHFHNIEGFSAGCVTAARQAGARVIFSLHNYHTICPQVYLMRGHRFPCMSYENGHACVDCVDVEPPHVERAIRARNIIEDLNLRHGDPQADLEAAWGEFKHLFSWPVRVARVGSRLIRLRRLARARRKDPSWQLPGEPFSPRTLNEPRPASGPDTRGKTADVLSEMQPHRDLPADHELRRPLLNVIQPEPPSEKHPNEYAARRAAMIQMLNQCDRVLAVSRFVREKFISLGVDERAITTMSIGTRINQVVRLQRDLTFDPPPFGDDADRPIRLTFLGYNHYYKGLPILVEALEMLRPEELARIDLSIYALDGETIEWAFRRLQPRLASLTFVAGYKYHDIPWILGGKDLTVVCSVWWDNAPQTVFESFACGVPVLGAAVGGIPDFVHDGVNGLLFRGNDREDLARRLREIIAEPAVLTRLRQGVRPPKDIRTHAAEIERLYADVMDPSGRSGAEQAALGAQWAEA